MDEVVTPHPAKFSMPILKVAGEMLTGHERGTAFDPFAGTGSGVLMLQELGYEAFGMEIESEWAQQCREVHTGDSLRFMEKPENAGLVSLVMTSPCYGNRMADHHEARDLSKRNTYRHQLGHKLSEDSAAGMQWGKDYRAFHERAWQGVWNILQPDGAFLLNIKDHIRKGQRQHVAEWHYATCLNLGFRWESTHRVAVPGNRQGENGDVRIDHEMLYLFRKPASPPSL